MKLSYKFRLIVLTLLFLLTTIFFVAFVSAKTIRDSAVTAFTDRGYSVIYRAKAMITIEDFMSLVNADTKDHPYYGNLYDKFFALKKEQGCRFLYTMIQVDGTKFKYIVDGSALPGTDEFSDYGTIEDISSYGPAPFECMEKQEVVVSDIIKQDGWGFAVSFYAPLIQNGKSIGFVACDYDANTLIHTIRGSLTHLILLAIICTVVGMIIIGIYINLFFRRLGNVTVAMQDISSGARDLTQRLAIKGETELDALSKAYNDVIEQLQEMMKKINSSIGVLSENSNVLLSQNKENLSLIESAKTSIEEIYAQADDQNALSEQVSNGIEGVEKAVRILDEKIIQQSEAVEKSSLAVEEINSNINAANNVLSQISSEYVVIVREAEDGQTKQNQVATQVDLIVQQAQNLAKANAVISSIASQTNLLAMNAAIEAAHAGESGKGFSVVADEIRKLAETSAKQSTAVRQLIKEIETSISGIVHVSKSSAQSFSSLGEKIQNMDSLLEEIKTDMGKQNEGAQNILDMMTLLSNATASIKESSETMKNNTIAVVDQINDLKESSQSILESGNNANEQLSKMNEFAATTTTQAEENADLTSEVDQIVSSYKIE